MNRCSIWNRLVFVLSLWLQLFKSYNPFSGVVYEERKMVIGNMQLDYKQLYKIPVFLPQSSNKIIMMGLPCYSESIYVHFSLNKSILKELWIFSAYVYIKKICQSTTTVTWRKIMSLASRTSNAIALLLKIFALLY